PLFMIPKVYEVRLDCSDAGSKKRPDFSYFVKVNLRAKKSINQQLNIKGGPNKSVMFTNMGDIIESFLMDLSFDGIYSSWPFCKSKLVIDKASMPVIESTFCHFVLLEQTNKLAEDFLNRRVSFTPPNQIMYGFTRENPDSPQIKR
ncbi:894_t:CDS:2, partial [Scutellospora calospora]